jgi:hypothetical protein
MKHLIRHKAFPTILIVVVTMIAVTSVLINTGSRNTHAASNDTLYISPATATETVGSTFTVAIRENSNSDQVNAVQANLTYSTSNLQFVSTSLSGSAFGITAANSGGSGAVSLSLGSTTPVTGDVLIANITFQVTAVGSGNITYAGSSSVLSYTTNTSVVSSMTGTSLTLQAAPTAPTTPPKTITKAPVTTTPTPSTGKTSIAPTNNPTPVSVPDNANVEISSGATVQTAPSDADQVTKVEYYLGSKLVATVTQSPYNYIVPTKTLRNGTYKLTTKTYYKDGTVTAKNTSLLVKNPFGWTQFGLQLRHYGWYIAIGVIIVAAAIVWLRVRMNRRSTPPPIINMPPITVG